MTTYHQVLVGAAPGDAITSMALQTRTELRRLGPSEIFARFIEPASASQVGALGDLPVGRPRDILIYHSSFGDPEVTRALLRRPERLVLVYHNITPAEFFTDTDPAFAAGLEWGRYELSLLKDRVVLAIADSRFNADELIRLGYTGVRIMAIGVRPRRLADSSNDPETELTLDEIVGVPFVLNISQLLPHKCQHVLLQAVHILQSVHRVELGLVLVGQARSATYERALNQLARSLRLRHIWLAGRQSDSSLATIYRRARVFGSASRHEGLGIPPLEAMAFGLPAVVRDAGATAETVGRGALVLPAASGPLMFAEALLAAHEDDRLRSSLIDSGFQRVSEFSAARSTRSLAEIIEAAGLAS